MEAATCIQTGVEKHYCLTCDYTYNRILPLEEHDFIYDHTIIPSEEEPGYDAYVCSVCGKMEHRDPSQD